MAGDDPQRSGGDRAQPIRVVAVLPGDDFTGPAGQVVSTAAELARRGVELRLVLLSRPGRETGRMPEQLRRHGLGFEVLRDGGPFDLGLPARLRQLLTGWQPDILETHGYKATALALLLSWTRPPWRWVGFFHGSTTESRRARFYHDLDRRMLGRADRAVTISELQRRELSRYARDPRVIGSAVTRLDSASAGPADPAPELTAFPQPRIAVIGRLSPEKGVDVLLTAGRLLADRGVRAHTFVVGDGPERRALQDQAAGLGLGDHTHFLGQVRDVARIYAAIDLLVIPSRSEGLPSVLLEALAADVPVVATAVGSIPSVLEPSGAGVLVPPASPRQLADAIEHALIAGDSEERRRARAAATREFSQERRATALTALYHEVLRERQESHHRHTMRAS